MDYLQTRRLPIEKYTQYNMSLHIAFIDYEKTFDSIEPGALFKAMGNAWIVSVHTPS